MNIYQRLIFPTLRWTDAEYAHDQSLRALSMAQRTWSGRIAMRRIAGKVPARPVECAGIQFPNELGVAAGYDKNAQAVAGLGLLGFGHVEVGTLTPQYQEGNDRPRIFRLPNDQALINRMGFPNEGVEAAIPRLESLVEKKNRPIIGVSLGKQKETPLIEAVNDYATVMRAVYTCADYLAINVSSPNTPRLRELQGGKYLEHLLTQLVSNRDDLAASTSAGRRPLFVKIAPDLTWPEIESLLAAVDSAGIDGIIATNTTTKREDLKDARWGETGGLSGRPLGDRSTEIVRFISHQTSGRLPIIAVGGIFTADDARKKLDSGATLVQIYTGLIYFGPGLPGRILRDLDKL